MYSYFYNNFFVARKNTGESFTRAKQAFAQTGNVSEQLFGIKHTLKTVGHAVSIPFMILRDLAIRPKRVYDLKKRIFKQINSDAELMNPVYRVQIENEIKQFIITKYPDMPTKEQELYTQFAISTYASSQEQYAPIVWKWAQHLLDSAIKKSEDSNKATKIVFMARDGIPPLNASNELKRLYPDKYKDVNICLGYLSRKVMKDLESKGTEGDQLFQKYMNQLGINKGDNIIFVDVGFAGSMIKPIKDKLLQGEFISSLDDVAFSFLISLTKNPPGYNADGFLANSSYRNLKSCEFAGSNLGVHWIEDTHQSPQVSPRFLKEIDVDGNTMIVPNTYKNGEYETIIDSNPKDYILKYWAEQAILKAHNRAIVDNRYNNMFENLSSLSKEKQTKVLSQEKIRNFDNYLDQIIQGERILFVDHDSNCASEYASYILNPSQTITIKSWEILYAGWDNAVCRFKPWTYLKKSALMIVMVINAFVTPIWTILDGLFFLFRIGISRIKLSAHSQKKPKYEGGCSGFFASPAFKVYFQSLRTKVEEMLNLDIYSDIQTALLNPQEHNKYSEQEKDFLYAISKLKYFNEKSVISYEELHREMTQRLEKIYAEICDKADNEISPILVKGKKFLKNLHYYKYLKVDLLPHITDHMVNSHGVTFESIMDQELGAFLSDAYSKLEKRPELGHDGQMTELFDSHYFGNIPFFLPAITKENGKICSMVRTASVTRDTKRFIGKTQSSEISDSFKMFMAGLKANNKKHLYINLMNRHKDNEAIRVNKIEEMDADNNNNVCVLSLDKNSDFYHQNWPYNQQTIIIEQFKQQFLDHVFFADKNFHWPNGLEMNENIISDIMKTVQKEYFSNKENLTVNERKNFIEFTYNYIIDYCIETLDFDSANITCKDCIDRAIAETVKYYVHNNRKAKKELDKNMKIKLSSLVLGLPILVANRPMEKLRFERLLGVLDYL